jgi:hypothetical protein
MAIHRENDNDIVTIIKSKMWNTKTHLPRPEYNNIINGLPKPDYIDDIKNLSNRTMYDKKYLKYKKKYLELKKLL